MIAPCLRGTLSPDLRSASGIRPRSFTTAPAPKRHRPSSPTGDNPEPRGKPMIRRDPPDGTGGAGWARPGAVHGVDC